MSEYDAIVIGTGAGGEGVIWKLNAAGMKLAVAEKELIGGLCAYWGCLPSKTLLRPGEIAWEARHGIGTSEPALDWPDIAKYRDYVTRHWDDQKQVKAMKDSGVEFHRGTATITGHGEVQVNGQTLRAPRLVIATGSEPSIPPIEGLQDVGYWTNREGTDLHEIPESVLILGGGAVGSELGQMLHSYGAQVSIVEGAPHLLGRESARAAAHVQKRFTARGMQLHLGRKAQKFEQDGDRKVATLDDGTKVSAKVVLVATGRSPLVKDLGLDAIEVTPTRRGIEVDDYCRVKDGVWAVGDVTGVAGFTHVAAYQADIATADIMGHPQPANYSDIPAVTFIDPEVASVGITDPEKAPEGMDVVSTYADLAGASRTFTYGRDLEGGLCLLADRADKVLVGAWAVGPVAGEWVQFASLAIRARIPVRVLADTIFAFPTFTRLFLGAIHDLQKQLA